MFNKFATKLAVFMLKRSTLSMEDRALLISCTLDKLDSIPLSDIISVNEQGTLLVNGKTVDLELAKSLRESSRAVLNSRAFKMIQNQVVYAAFSYAARTATSIDQLILGKAAIWWGQKENEYLNLLAGTSVGDDE